MQPGSSPIQSGFTLLSALEEFDLDWIFQTGTEQPIPAGTVIVQEGVRGESIYFVLEGLLSISSAELGRREIARLGPGQVFGEMSFIEDRPTSATVSALEDSCVLAIAREVLERKLAGDPALAARLYKALAVIAAGRLREFIGTLARWMEVDESLATPMPERWQEIANRTQQFKQWIMQAEKGGPGAADLTGELPKFSSFLNGAIGIDSPEPVDIRDDLGARIQRELTAYFLKARTIQRLFEKPRGYPCDSESLDMIAANQAEGAGASGPLLDRAFLELPAIRAIRHREQAIASAVVQFAAGTAKVLHVAGIGCGAAGPLFAAFAAIPDKTRIDGTAIDFDARAVDAATSRCQTLGLADRLRLVSTNIVHLASGRLELDIADQDLIYGLNVADYLDDRLLLRFLNLAFCKLRPGGRLLLSFIHRRNPDHAFLDYVVHWKINHRSEEEINALFHESSFQTPAINFAFDQDKIAFLAVCQKPGRS